MKTSRQRLQAHRDRLLRGVPLFACLAEEEFQNMRGLIRDKHFTRQQVILYEEETTSYLYVIYTGKVKVVQLDEEGQEHIIALHGSGEYFGEMALLDGKTAPARVIALEDADVGFLSKADFEQHLLSNEKVVQEIIALLCARLRDAWFTYKILGLHDASARVRAVLTRAGRMFGVLDQRGIIVNARLTHSDVAGMASLSRETASRIIKRLETTGEVMVIDGRRLVLTPSFQKVQLT